jgi:hypothetical protein
MKVYIQRFIFAFEYFIPFRKMNKFNITNEVTLLVEIIVKCTN